MRFRKKSFVAGVITAAALGSLLLTATPANAESKWDCWKNGVVCAAPKAQPTGLAAWQPKGHHLYLVSHGSNIVVFYKVQGQPWRYNTLSGMERHIDKNFRKGLDFDFKACTYGKRYDDGMGSCGKVVDSHT